MPHKKNCRNCGKEFEGSINKFFCTDACRKYHKRHGGIGLSGIKTTFENTKSADKSAHERTLAPARDSSIGNYFMKRAIDVMAATAQNKLNPSQHDEKKAQHPKTELPPLEMKTADAGSKFFRADGKVADRMQLSPSFQSFLGNISYPFKMLVWGLPGQGKSTFCMQLANEIARESWEVLYVSGEERLDSDTLKDKQWRCIDYNLRSSVLFVSRLPHDATEWTKVIVNKTEKNEIFIRHKAVFYDSVTKLAITPFYVDAVANDCKMPFFAKKVSHVFISHAHKDGSSYRGDGSWGHEVDVIIRCEAGRAIIEKNRFATATNGQPGSELKIF